MHTPYQAPDEYLDRYKNIEDPSRRAYAAGATAMDDQIGRVIAALDQKGMLDNTLIIFQSDNGGTRDAMFAGAITDMSKVVLPADNGPYRGGKGTLYEGGARVVALATWPGHIKEGRTVNEMIHTVDLYPTLLGIAGGNLGKAKPLDGVSAKATHRDRDQSTISALPSGCGVPAGRSRKTCTRGGVGLPPGSLRSPARSWLTTLGSIPNAGDHFSRGASRSAGMERGWKRCEDRWRDTFVRKRGRRVANHRKMACAHVKGATALRAT